MHIIGITISVDYTDKLPFILSNATKLDKWFIVTDPNDVDTIQYVERLQYPNIKLLYFDRFRCLSSKHSTFNKSGALHFAQSLLHHIYPESWILILDSDIVLPPEFDVSTHLLNENILYGCKRTDYATLSDYETNHGIPYHGHKKHFFAGYFQLYYRKDIFYPPESRSCFGCDYEFRNQFHKTHRRLLPYHVKHLGLERINWKGRREPIWTPFESDKKK